MVSNSVSLDSFFPINVKVMKKVWHESIFFYSIFLLHALSLFLTDPHKDIVFFITDKGHCAQ